MVEASAIGYNFYKFLSVFIGRFLTMKKNIKQRVCQRFELKVPALVRQATKQNSKHHQLLLTRDISDKGAYFNTMEAEAFSGTVEIELLLIIAGRDEEYNYVYMTASGEIIRREKMGLAVIFNDDCRLVHFHMK